MKLQPFLFFICVTFFCNYSFSDNSSEKKADEKIYNIAYAQLLNSVYGASMVEPQLLQLSGKDIEGFAVVGDYFWEVKFIDFIHQKSMGLVFVNAKTGKSVTVCKPGEWEKNQCSYGYKHINQNDPTLLKKTIEINKANFDKATVIDSTDYKN